MRRLARLLLLVLLVAAARADDVAPPPRDPVEECKLAPSRAKQLDVDGLLVLASAKVSGYALSEAAYLIDHMVGARSEVLIALVESHARVVVMAPTEMTTDIPENADLIPRAYHDRRGRGLCWNADRPVAICGEENLLEFPGDPYDGQSVLIHEFAHAVHGALSKIDPSFDRRLRAAYDHAVAAGLWEGTYASTNHAEYWAEATQSWFDANSVYVAPILTRDQVKARDPDVAKLLTEVFGDGPWRYARPSTRDAAGRAHLDDFDPATAEAFEWPDRAPPIERQGVHLTVNPPDAPSATPQRLGKPTSVLFVNHRAKTVYLDWVDRWGIRRRKGEVASNWATLQSTFDGHVWFLSDDDGPVGVVVAEKEYGIAQILPERSIPLLRPADAPKSSPKPASISVATTLFFVNRRAKAVHLDWLDGDGKRVRYGDVAPNEKRLQPAFARHVWLVSDDDGPIGGVVAPFYDGRIEIR